MMRHTAAWRADQQLFFTCKQTSGTITWDYAMNSIALDAYYGSLGAGRFVLEIIVLLFFFANVLSVSFVCMSKCIDKLLLLCRDYGMVAMSSPTDMAVIGTFDICTMLISSIDIYMHTYIHIQIHCAHLLRNPTHITSPNPGTRVIVVYLAVQLYLEGSGVINTLSRK